MATPRFNIERLKDIPIRSVVEQFDELHKSGCQYVTLCPNPEHNDHHPSLRLNEKTGHNYCHCFACGFGGSNIDYLMTRNGWTFQQACEWLSSKFGIPYLDGGYASAQGLLPKTREVKRDEQVITYIPSLIVDPTITTQNSFSQCVALAIDYATAVRVTRDYKIGALGRGNNLTDTIFWSIDEQGRVRNGKVQRYCTDIGSSSFAHCLPLFDNNQRCYWLTKWLHKQPGIPIDAVFDIDCLFGEHLLPLRPMAPVVITESPKNAIAGSALFNEYVWLASGNKSALKPELLRCLRGREVFIYPDLDAIDDWKDLVNDWKLYGIIDDLGIKSIFVNDFCKRYAPAGQPKYDIGDYIFEHARKYRHNQSRM